MSGKKAIEEALQKERKKVQTEKLAQAVKMLQAGLTVVAISDLTDLTIEQIEALK